MQEKRPCVYILTNRPNGTLYVGVTAQPCLRLSQHRTGKGSAFARKYGLTKVVWYELHETMEAAIIREKQLKKWRRSWKIELVVEHNPNWKDLYDEVCAP